MEYQTQAPSLCWRDTFPWPLHLAEAATEDGSIFWGWASLWAPSPPRCPLRFSWSAVQCLTLLTPVARSGAPGVGGTSEILLWHFCIEDKESKPLKFKGNWRQEWKSESSTFHNINLHTKKMGRIWSFSLLLRHAGTPQPSEQVTVVLSGENLYFLVTCLRLNNVKPKDIHVSVNISKKIP